MWRSRTASPGASASVAGVGVSLSSTYQAAAQKVYNERTKPLSPVRIQLQLQPAPQVELEAELQTETVQTRPAKSGRPALSLERQNARLRWKKIKSRIDEIRKERSAAKQATGWESIFKRVREMVAAERARSDLYERYGFTGLPLGKFPRSNPMSLFPAAVYPRGDEPEVPARVSPLIRKTRQEMTRYFAQSARGSTASGSASRVGSSHFSHSRMSQTLESLRSGSLSLATSRATTAKTFDYH